MFARAARPFFALVLLTTALASSSRATEPGPVEFHVRFDKAVTDKPFTGRVYVMLSTKDREPRFGPNWFKPDPFFAVDVRDWRPGEKLVVANRVMAFPVPIQRIDKTKYSIQAVMDLDRGGRQFGNSPGNGFSKVSKDIELDPEKTGKVELLIDQVVPERQFKETATVKLVDIESKLLTAFHKRPTRLRAGVILPASYNEKPGRKYPVIYDIPGFSGDHFMALRLTQATVTKQDGEDFLSVVLDPECRLGHHVFADSANNGPCGKALIEELIPHIEKEFRAVGKPEARFVTGHSSGGWSSLWLQITYPDFFGGCWSTAPDPVDFRDFQLIDIYKPGNNAFLDDKGKRRPLARSRNEVTLYYQPFSDMEDVMGRGGQLQSFEAVFSPRGSDGQPRKLWNRSSGIIDAEVARAWEAYDIRLVLERNWKTLGPKLRGKLHIWTGAEDTFYLDGAVRLLKESLTKLESDAEVEIIPGRNHGNVVDKDLRQKIARQMAERFRKSQASADQAKPQAGTRE